MLREKPVSNSLTSSSSPQKVSYQQKRKPCFFVLASNHPAKTIMALVDGSEETRGDELNLWDDEIKILQGT
jgi:hypothetical protein